MGAFNYFVTPKEADAVTERAAELIAACVEAALAT